jgi:TonB-dependent siderophore receptor
MRTSPSMLLILICALAAPVLAQDKPAEGKPATEAADSEPKDLGFGEKVDVEGELPVVPPSNLTTMKMPASPQSVPVSVSVVPEALTDTQDGRTLGDALKNASGVNVAPGFGVFDFFVIRGFDSLSSGLVLVDGAPEPESMLYPLYNVRQVEALKGPGGFLYGGNPLAGAVQLVRKQPVSRSFADFSGSFGSFGTFDGTLDANAARSDGRLAFRLNGVYRDSNGYRDDKDSRQAGVNPALTWRPDDKTRLVLNAEYVRSEFQPDSGIPLVGPPPTFAGTAPADVPRTRSYQSPFDESNQNTWRLRLDAERRFSDRFTLRDKLYFTDLDWKSDGTLILGAFPNQTGRLEVARILPLLDDRQKLLGNQLEGLLSFSTGAVRHEALLGLELLRFTDVFDLRPALLPGIDLANPVETAQEPLFILEQARQRGDAKSTIVAPYLVDRVSFGERFKLFLGGRLDVLDYEEKLSATNRDETRFSPMGGLVFSPEPTLSLYASGGAAFAPPSTLVVGERAPEKSRQFEVGVKKTFLSGKAFASLAGYHLEKDDIAIPDATGITRQLGDQRANGLELELSAEVSHGWTAFAAYGFNDSELTRFAELISNPFDPTQFQVLDRSGNTPAFAPRHLLNLWTVKEFANGLGLGAGVRSVSAQLIAENNAFSLDSYATVDAMISYRRKNLRASVNFKNLTDTDYFTRGYGSSSVLPADPFAVYARIELRLGKAANP